MANRLLPVDDVTLRRMLFASHSWNACIGVDGPDGPLPVICWHLRSGVVSNDNNLHTLPA